MKTKQDYENFLNEVLEKEDTPPTVRRAGDLPEKSGNMDAAE
jgi:hypothetical protein